MGLVIGVPLAYFMASVFKNEEGVIHGFKEAWASLLISWQRRGIKKRHDFYDAQELNDLYKLAIKISPAEEDIEFKRNIANNETDNVFLYGGNTSGERLIARVSRRPDGLTSAWLVLKLGNGDLYQLANDKFSVEPKTGRENFVCGGLRIKCLVSMRRWRVSYNGLLRKTNDNSLHHVKISFIWTTSSGPYDLKDNMRKESLANYLARQSGRTNYNSLTKYLDSYIQTGFFFGTVQFGLEDEQEMYLWGIRKRSLDISDEGTPMSNREYFHHSKDGEFLYYGQIKFPEQVNILQHAFVIRQNSLGGNCRKCYYNYGEKHQDEEIKVLRGPFEISHTIRTKEDRFNFKIGDDSNSDAKLTFTTICVNGDDIGHGLIVQTINVGVKEKPSENELSLPSIILPKPIEDSAEINMVVPLTQSQSRLVALTGGKGSSLAQLTLLSQKSKLPFQVPQGVVVTTTAYLKFIEEADLSQAITSVETIAWDKTPTRLQEACDMVVSVIEKKSLSISIQKTIGESLRKIFGDKLNDTKFAIRSSAAGEDSEELSAAGQMTTYLGVKGLENVMASVVKCWASQFSFIAIQYKRQNGQILNSPMAVVIQEMVPAEVAGVMFTCDPVTGNPANVTITANYGIGESVVSAVAEPDTVIHHRDDNGLNGEFEVQIGKKSVEIVMAENGGVEEKHIERQLADKCCLSDDDGKRLAELGLLVENVYGCPIDIEWGIKSNIFYLLQARPITTFDKETDFEIVHELDSPIRSEEEYGSTANVGEVMPGAFSFLGATSMTKTFEVIMQWHFAKRNKNMFPASPYYSRGMVRIQNHAFFCLFDSLLRFYHGKKSLITDSQMIAMFGRILDDEYMLNKAAKRNALYQPISSIVQTYYLIGDMLFGNSILKKTREGFFNRTIELERNYGSHNAYEDLWQQSLVLIKPSFIHSTCSIVSSLYNSILLSILVSQYEEWCPEVYRDFAYILSTCDDVESVDVPNAIENLANTISECTDPIMFKNIKTEEALKWLEESNNKASEEFKSFLKSHGHRCYKEFDVISIPWGDDPTTLVKTLQEMAVNSKGSKTHRKTISVSETIRNLQTTLSFKNKLLMRIAIPLCRKGVGMRERSKSLMIKLFDTIRKAYVQLADILVQEGRLPDARLIHHLTVDEIEKLILTRSPKLIQKAIRRRQLYPGMDSLVYPEISKGVPKPVNYKDNKPSEDVNLTMKGVPVSTGIAKGPARVATNVLEAASIQPGEILIAYSTDIGWSPYFPMLAGVATELGGLVSHGAVVAREYGLPCVVGVQGATLQFKTGDMVMLNGNKGILQRIQS